MLWLLTAEANPRLLLGILVGSLGVLVSAARLTRLFSREQTTGAAVQPVREKTGLIVLMLIILLLMAVMGASTQFLSPRFLEILAPFTQLVPIP